MSVAYIVNNDGGEIISNRTSKVRLTEMTRNGGSIIRSFHPDDDGVNPSSFMLGVGTYRIDLVVKGVLGVNVTWAQAQTLVNAAALYDEYAGLVAALLTPAYRSYTASSGLALRLVNPFMMQASCRFQVTRGEKNYSIRSYGAIEAFSAYVNSGQISAPLGGSALSLVPTQVKIIQTA